MGNQAETTSRKAKPKTIARSKAESQDEGEAKKP